MILFFIPVVVVFFFLKGIKSVLKHLVRYMYYCSKKPCGLQGDITVAYMKGVDGRGRQSYSPWRHNQNFFHRFFGYNLPRVAHDQRLKRVHSKRERVINIIGLNLNIYSLTVNCSLVVIPLLSACTAPLGQICKYAFRRGIMRPLGKRQVTSREMTKIILRAEVSFLHGF